MSSNLVTFLTKIGRDPKTRLLFKTEPHTAMVDAELDPGDIAAVLSKNPAVIHQAVVSSLNLAPGQAKALGDLTIVVVF